MPAVHHDLVARVHADSGGCTLGIQNVDDELTLLSAGITAEHPYPVAAAELIGAAGLGNRIRNRGLRTEGKDLGTSHFTRYRNPNQGLEDELRILLEPRQEGADVTFGRCEWYSPHPYCAVERVGNSAIRCDDEVSAHLWLPPHHHPNR